MSEMGRGAGGRQGRCAVPPEAGKQAWKTCEESSLEEPQGTSSAYALQSHKELGLSWLASVLLIPREEDALKLKVSSI